LEAADLGLEVKSIMKDDELLNYLIGILQLQLQSGDPFFFEELGSLAWLTDLHIYIITLLR
jgi:hypothetical protein